jgi:tryptophanyl-tRNA synthetase
MIMDLQDPTWKMSTSAQSDAGVVRLLDPPDAIRRKLRSAVTDSGRDVVRAPEKPGVTNLIDILTSATGEPPEAIEARYDGQGYGGFKADVAEAVVELVTPIQARFRELRDDPAELASLLAKGREKAQGIASKTLALAYERVGFVTV